jgi:hypothetical protein
MTAVFLNDINLSDLVVAPSTLFCVQVPYRSDRLNI